MLLLLIEFLRPLTFREMILHTYLLDITFQKKTKILQYKIGFLEMNTKTKNTHRNVKHSTQNN